MNRSQRIHFFQKRIRVQSFFSFPLVLRKPKRLTLWFNLRRTWLQESSLIAKSVSLNTVSLPSTGRTTSKSSIMCMMILMEQNCTAGSKSSILSNLTQTTGRVIRTVVFLFFLSFFIIVFTIYFVIGYYFKFYFLFSSLNFPTIAIKFLTK